MEATAWILSLMLAVAPPRDSSNAKWAYVDARETKEAAVARYEEIAKAISEVAFDPTEAPLFTGPHGRARTAALLVAVASVESGFRRDVDLGIGPKARGSGIDSCLMQVRPSRNALTSEGWTWRDLVEDRQKCFRSGMHVLRRSLATCAKDPILDRLAAFTSGKCGEGLPGSRIRMSLAQKLFSTRPPSERDATWLLASAAPAQPVDRYVACVARCGKMVGGQSLGE